MYLQNVLDYLKFLFRHQRFGHNQIHKQSNKFSDCENQVYNKIYVSKWLWKQQKKPSFWVTRALVSIWNNEKILSFSHWDQTLWPVYITMKNLDRKTW